MAISFGDNVRVVSTPITISFGLAGLTGQVYGATTPSITHVEVVGGVVEDYAINVQLEGRTDSVWFAAGLLEFIDYRPGTEIRIGKERRIRSPSGEWIEG